MLRDHCLCDRRPAGVLRPCRAAVTREEVERAIRDGVRYLKGLQHPNGSWSDVENEAKTGTTSLIALALLTAGESPDSLRKTLEYLRGFGPNDLHSTYAVALQTMVFAAAEPERDQLRIANNVSWLERAQIKPGDSVYWPGSWTYSDSKRGRPGDNSNTQYALLGLSPPARWEFPSNRWSGSCHASIGKSIRNAMAAGLTPPTHRTRLPA